MDVAYVTDIPEMPRPQVTEYRVQVSSVSWLRQTGTQGLAMLRGMVRTSTGQLSVRTVCQ